MTCWISSSTRTAGSRGGRASARSREDGQTWRRLDVTFPPEITTHSAEQVFYFADDGLLRRLDHTVEADGGGPGERPVTAGAVERVDLHARLLVDGGDRA